MKRARPSGGGGGTSMITYGADKFPSDTALCLFESLLSAFLDVCFLSVDVIMLKNQFQSIVFSRCYFIKA